MILDVLQEMTSCFKENPENLLTTRNLSNISGNLVREMKMIWIGAIIHTEID